MKETTYADKNKLKVKVKLRESDMVYEGTVHLDKTTPPTRLLDMMNDGLLFFPLTKVTMCGIILEDFVINKNNVIRISETE
ncbi:MAG: hypothetical protein PF440_00410 [Thiomicrorhabdus sp.]|jgi:hypothetical protein|nr:hypothetical protein [Thiomicrorhabdus sp.]